jgi:hypothetical protein
METKPQTRPRCSDAYCRRYQMTVREFIRLGGYEADASFATRLGLRCAKIYHSIYNKPPTKRRRGEAWRNKVCVFPCGAVHRAGHQTVNLRRILRWDAARRNLRSRCNRNC